MTEPNKQVSVDGQRFEVVAKKWLGDNSRLVMTAPRSAGYRAKRRNAYLGDMYPQEPARTSDRWIRSLADRPGARIQLVIFPHAGGTASAFLPFAQALPTEIGVLAIQYPGRQDRRAEPGRAGIAELAEETDTALREQLTGPYAFLGHSMGAVVAHEVTRRRAVAGVPLPERLFVSGRRAPGVARSGPDAPRTDDGILAELRSFGGTPALFLDDPELRAEVLRVMRDDYRIIDAYEWVPAPPVGCPITALTGDADPQASVDDAAAWSVHTSAGFDLRVFPGGHFYLDEQRQPVAEAVSAALPAAS